MLQDWAGSAGARRVEIGLNLLLSTLRWKTKFPRASFYPVSIGFESQEKIGCKLVVPEISSAGVLCSRCNVVTSTRMNFWVQTRKFLVPCFVSLPSCQPCHGEMGTNALKLGRFSTVFVPVPF